MQRAIGSCVRPVVLGVNCSNYRSSMIARVKIVIDLKDQIESAYKNRGGIIWLPKKVPTAATRLGYCGHISPFRNKADWFHVGRFTPDSAFPPRFPIGTSVMRECCANVLLTPLYLSSEEVNE